MRASNGVPIQALEDDRAVAILFVGSATEPGPGAAPESPFVGGGISVGDSEHSPRIKDAGMWR